jgi:NAD-dependent SIR2 family protein deacetylase
MIQPLSSSYRLFVLTDAGISAENGLPTFRGAHCDSSMFTFNRCSRRTRDC